MIKTDHVTLVSGSDINGALVMWKKTHGISWEEARKQLKVLLHVETLHFNRHVYWLSDKAAARVSRIIGEHGYAVCKALKHTSQEVIQINRQHSTRKT